MTTVCNECHMLGGHQSWCSQHVSTGISGVYTTYYPPAAEVHRRERIATAAMQGMLSFEQCGTPEEIAVLALDYADALIAALDAKEE